MTTTTLAPVDDGMLTIGLLLPAVGTDPEIGRSLLAGTQLAVTEINAAGGVNGRPVRLVSQSESDSFTETAAAIEELATDGVDAFIGPASSRVALTNTLDITSSGAMACSATATALPLGDLPDDDRLFRTAPSDALQAGALAELVERTGSSSATVAYIDDSYGSPFAAEVVAQLERRGFTNPTQLPFANDPDALVTIAEELSAEQQTTVVILADAATGSALLDTIEPGSATTQWVVNDALRDVRSANAAVLGVQGAAAVVYPTNGDFQARLLAVDPAAGGAFAAHAYDCVNLIALAAEAADSTLGPDVAAQMRGVSRSGSTCADFASCVSGLGEGRNIDYVGVSGAVDLDDNGDAASGTFDVFDFSTDPNVSIGRVDVG